MMNVINKKNIIRLTSVWLVVLAREVFKDFFSGKNIDGDSATILFVILITAIMAAAFGVVHEADKLAERLGEPYGTLILTLSIVAIEVILIAAMMAGPGGSSTIGKDSIFAVMMIIMNLLMGICILSGGLRFKEQDYNAQGTLSYFSMIVLLGGASLILPNYIVGAGNQQFSSIQAICIAGLVAIVYVFFLLHQIGGYRHLYIQPAKGNLEIPFGKYSATKREQHLRPSQDKKGIFISVVLLIAMVLPIVLMSHSMTVVVDYGIQANNLPVSLSGILIAIIVFTPESITAVKAALNNEMQRTINLCHGAFVSTVGLTVPVILVVGLVTNRAVQFGLTGLETVLFILTLLLSLFSFSGRRTSPFLGLLHLALFGIFLLFVFNP